MDDKMTKNPLSPLWRVPGPGRGTVNLVRPRGGRDDRQVALEAREGWLVGTKTPSYRGFRFPVEIISHCVWLYHRFPLSFREVQEMMLQRGIVVSHETVRQWCAKFGLIDPHSALGQQLFNIAIRKSVTEVPAHCQHDHLPREPEAGERRWWREDRTNTADAAHELEHARTTSSLCATVCYVSGGDSTGCLAPR
jgi:hypothetical protein